MIEKNVLSERNKETVTLKKVTVSDCYKSEMQLLLLLTLSVKCLLTDLVTSSSLETAASGTVRIENISNYHSKFQT